jgi:hypothetical protein
MTAPYRRTDAVDVIGNHERRVSILEALSGNNCGDWVEPTFINSWANAGAPFCDVAYRLCGVDTLEFKGHCTGGASGTVAFYLDAEYWPLCDLSTCTDVVTASTPGVAQIYVSAADGSVTITSVF